MNFILQEIEWHVCTNLEAKYKIKVKQYRYRPGVAQRVPGS
jgi:hypothetical protein